MSKTAEVPTNNGVKFENSQGLRLNANLLGVRRHTISFEIYNPSSSVQLSEVLKDFRIRLNGRLIYEGEAVVSSIVNTAVLLVCEATLGNGWKEVDFLVGPEGNGNLATQFEGLVDEWKMLDRISLDGTVFQTDLKRDATGVNLFLETRKVPMEAFINPTALASQAS